MSRFQRLLFFLFPFLLVASYVWRLQQVEEQETRLPKPIEYLEQIRKHKLSDPDLRQEYRSWRKQFKQGRKDWIADMHRAAPGTDWKAMDDAVRDVRRQERIQQRLDGRTQRELNGQWTEKGSNNLSGRMHVPDVNLSNGRIYAGSSGGNVWTADASGNGWESLNDWIQFDDIKMMRHVAHENTGHLLVLASGPTQIWRSTDDGFSWQSATGMESFESWGYPLRGVVTHGADPLIFVLGVEWNYDDWHAITTLYRSDDLGSSFSQIASFDSGGRTADIWTDPFQDCPVYVSNEGQLYEVMPDNSLVPLGDTVLGLNPADISSVQIQGTVVAGTPWIYVLNAYSPSGDSYVLRSTNGGSSFIHRGTAPLHPFMRNSFACSILDPDHIALGGVNTYRSFNGGQSWQLVNEWWEYYDNMESRLHADVPGIRFFPDGNGEEYALICTDGGLYRSDDDLLTVQNLSMSGLRISQYYSVYTNRQDAGVIYAGAQDQGFQRALADPGGIVDFEQTISGDYGHIVSGDGGASIWTVYPGFVMYYPDLVNSTQARFWDFQGSNYFWMPPLMADPVNPEICWLGGGGSSGGARMWRMTHTGSSLQGQEQNFDFSQGGSARISAMATSPLNHALRYVLTSEGDFWYTQDAGLGWQQSPAFSGPDAHYFYGASIVASPQDPDRVYIAGSGYSNPAVYVSEDHGQSFEALMDGLPNTLVYGLAVTPDDSLLFAATEVGPYGWERSTGLWTELGGQDAPDQTWWAVDFVPEIQTARFVTYGRGIWDYTLPQHPESVADLQLGVTGGDVLLAWTAAQHAEAYRVEASFDPYFRSGVEVLGVTEETEFRDVDARSLGRRLYRVVSLGSN